MFHPLTLQSSSAVHYSTIMGYLLIVVLFYSTASFWLLLLNMEILFHYMIQEMNSQTLDESNNIINSYIHYTTVLLQRHKWCIFGAFIYSLSDTQTQFIQNITDHHKSYSSVMCQANQQRKYRQGSVWRRLISNSADVNMLNMKKKALPGCKI